MYSERKAAQAAAWFLRQADGRLPHLKLMKLMYLADRHAMAEMGFPITFDRVVAMRHGPVLSMTLDLINGDVESRDDGWEAWIGDRAEHEVALRERPVERRELDELSAAEIDVLGAVWNKFGQMSKWQLRDYTHDHCSEWHDPEGSAFPITHESIFKALGYSPADAKRLASGIEEEVRVDRLLVAL